MSRQQKTPLGKWEGNLQSGRSHLQNLHQINGLHPEYVSNFYKLIKKKTTH